MASMLFLVAILSHLLLLYALGAVNGTENGIDVNSIHKILEASFKCHNNPGVVVSMVKDGKVLFSRGYGVTDLDRKYPVNQHTVFNVASLSKNMASALFVKLLAEKTNLTLDSKIKELLGDDFNMVDNFRSREMAFADILGHRTGVPPNNIIRFNSNLTRQNLLRHLSHLQTPDQFRVKYYYNNLMYGLATYIAEVLGKEPWEDLINRHFFKPLGMTKSTFVTRIDYSRNDVAWPYAEYNSSLVRVPFEHSRRWGLLAGSVALATTAEDMAKWMNFHLSNGKDSQGQVVMEERLLAELHVPRMALPSPTLENYRKPNVPHTISRNTYTMGLRRGFYRGYQRLSHSGSNHGFRALLSLLPTENVGVFMGMTGRDDNYQYRHPIHMYLMDLALGVTPWLNASTICSYPAPWRPASTVEVSEAAVPMFIDSGALKFGHDEYEGIYENDAYGHLEVTFNSSQSRLVLTYGWATWLLIPRRDTNDRELFYAKGIDLTIAYDLDPIEFIREASQITKIMAFGFEKNAPPVFRKSSLQRDKRGSNGATTTEVPFAFFCFLLFVCVTFSFGVSKP